MDKNSNPRQIRVLSEQDTEAFRVLRLLALKESPEAFGADFDEFSKASLDEVKKRIVCNEDRFVLGAFAPTLVGIAGFYRRPGIKTRHTGEIWGVYVAPDSRGTGIGRALMVELIAGAVRCNGLKRLVLTVVAGNKSTITLYENLGFYHYGTDHGSLNVQGQMLDEDLMALRLES